MASTRARPEELRRPVLARCLTSGKTCYPTNASAAKAGRRHGLHSTAYRCEHCGCHHFTSQPKRVRKAIRLLLGVGA